MVIVFCFKLCFSVNKGGDIASKPSKSLTRHIWAPYKWKILHNLGRSDPLDLSELFTFQYIVYIRRRLECESQINISPYTRYECILYTLNCVHTHTCTPRAYTHMHSHTPACFLPHCKVKHYSNIMWLLFHFTLLYYVQVARRLWPPSQQSVLQLSLALQ